MCGRYPVPFDPQSTPNSKLASILSCSTNARHNSVRLAAIPVIKEQDSATSGSRNASEWHIWKTADKLQLTGISSTDKDLSESTQGIINRIIPILYDWGEKWAGRNEWQGLLNKSSLLHEVEESIVALSFLLEFLERRVGHTPDLQQITVVDVACGKGVMSMISSYLFQNDDRIKKIIMLDKADINWDHIEKANLSAEKENRPFIECWSSCNLHEIDGIVKRLETQTPVALVGIHLCKTLSPTCIGIVNSLTAKHCPFFVLAPCCLPRIATQSLQKQSIGEKSIMKVRRYESIDERRRRMESKLKRDAALSRRPPTTMSDQLEMMQSNPCWKCGETGHLKAECPSIQATSKPRLIQPPYVDVDISHVLLSESPFTLYCELLSSSLLREKVKVVDTGLANEKAKHQNGNWNKGRKAMYIVAESSSF
eukprot:scaffold4567_cov276-Chaetoceros_neogracile.AAC.3